MFRSSDCFSGGLVHSLAAKSTWPPGPILDEVYLAQRALQETFQAALMLVRHNLSLERDRRGNTSSRMELPGKHLVAEYPLAYHSQLGRDVGKRARCHGSCLTGCTSF